MHRTGYMLTALILAHCLSLSVHLTVLTGLVFIVFYIIMIPHLIAKYIYDQFICIFFGCDTVILLV